VTRNSTKKRPSSVRLRRARDLLREQHDQILKRLKSRGVVRTQEPTRAGTMTIAVCSDTCGNLIQLYQPPYGR